MASDINHTILTGRLTGDVKSNNVGGKTVFSGSIAVNRYSKKDSKDIASFFNFSVWAGTEGQAKFYTDVLKKGTPIVLDGALVQESWEKDGQKQSRVIIQANSINPMTRGGASSEAGFQEDGFPE